MKLHGNAELSLNKRRRLALRVEDGWTLTKAAEAAEVSVRTARKWVRRYHAEGETGLLDRSSRPHRSPTATPEQRVQLIALLRGSTRMTGAEIAEVLAMPITTVQGILTRIGLGRRCRLDQEQIIRYERSRPGELVHIDVKKLGRIKRGAGKRVTGGSSHDTGRITDAAGKRRGTAGWEFCHVAIDDFSRLAYVEVLEDERATTAVGFLRRALRFYRAHGVAVERVMTDGWKSTNGQR
jgi:transposase